MPNSASFKLEKRFLQPENWKWNSFIRDGRDIRFGSAIPKDVKSIVVALPGLSEFGEKYFEIANEMLEQGYGFVVIDWMGQGASGRYLDNPLKRHGSDFQNDVDDLHAVIELIRQDPRLRGDAIGGSGDTNVSFIMLAHSMGGNIGLRYLIEHPNVFKTAAFSAPMVGIHALQFLPRWLALGLTHCLNTLIGRVFTSLHGKNSRLQNKIFTPNPLSSDPVRFKLMEYWMSHNRKLDIGDVTFGWVYHAIRSCYFVQDQAHRIQTPCFFALGTKDIIVSNDAIRKAVHSMPNARLVELEGALHEIPMEADIYRQRFMDGIVG